MIDVEGGLKRFSPMNRFYFDKHRYDNSIISIHQQGELVFVKEEAQISEISGEFQEIGIAIEKKPRRNTGK